MILLFTMSSRNVKSFRRKAPFDKRASQAGKSGKTKLAALRAQSGSLKNAKMAALRQIANASTAGFLGIEKKFYDTALADTAVGIATDCTGGMYNPSATSLVCTPVQGDGEQNRDGKRIVIDSLILKGHVYNDGSASEAWTLQARKVFVAVVLDTQTNAAAMTSDLCFKNTAAQAASNVEPLKNLLSGKRFRILKSQVFDVTPLGAADAAANSAFNGISKTFDWYLPFKGGLPIEFNAGTTASVANVVSNSLHVVAFSSAAGNLIGYNARIRFQG